MILTGNHANLDHLAQRNDRLLTTQGIAAIARADCDFHAGLIALAGNRTTLAAYHLLGPLIIKVMQIGQAAHPVQALRARDRIAHAYLVNRHLEVGLHHIAST